MDTPSTSRSPSRDTLFKRSLNTVNDLLSPFSSAAINSLPKLARPRRYTRADAIPDAANDEGQMPTVRDYHAISSLPPNVRVPKKIATPIRVEVKVCIAVLVGTLALALFNGSKDEIATKFAYGYAFISVGTVVYGFALYQYRISMIRRRDPGHFGLYPSRFTIFTSLISA
ncbi:hypothetical protein H0H93_000172 [Arthromyces matolae]|nr:hypothetical protein H0H93_000172 [Arthromyces matolae]